MGFAIGDAVPGLGERRTMQVTAAMSVIAMVNEYMFWRERQPRMTPALYGQVLAHVALTLGAYGVAAKEDAADEPFPK